jgi:hypothetical protein
VRPLRYDRSALIALSFILLSVGSAFYLSAATLNYLRLYPALGNVQYQLTKLSFLRDPSSNRPSLTALVVVRNPSDYSGFRLGSVSLTNYFYLRSDTNKTLFSAPNSLSASNSIHREFGPNSVVSVGLPIQLTLDEQNQLTSFNSTHYGDIMASVQLRVDILTFLEAATGSVPFTGTQNVTLSSS